MCEGSREGTAVEPSFPFEGERKRTRRKWKNAAADKGKKNRSEVRWVDLGWVLMMMTLSFGLATVLADEKGAIAGLEKALFSALLL